MQPKPLTLMSAYINEEADTQNSDAAGSSYFLICRSLNQLRP